MIKINFYVDFMIEVINLVKIFGKKEAVSQISFKIEKNKFVGIIGQNGAGKSTTIKSIIGEILPTSGKILFDNKEINVDNYAYKKNFFYIPQKPIFYEYLTGFEYLNWISSIYNVKNNFLDLLKKFDILEDSKRLMLEYSEGMIKKIVLIAAIISDANILILDEVFSGLDPVAVYDFKILLKNLIKKEKTIIFVSHILESVEKLCDQIIMMKNGSIIEFLDESKLLDLKNMDKTLEDYYMEKIR